MNTTATAPKGLEGVVAADTRLSDVKGDIGELIYCGYNINDLAGAVSYEEVVFLLFENRLPNRQELQQLKAQLAAARGLPSGVIEILKTMPKDAAPMHVLRTGVSALGCFDRDPDNIAPEMQKKKALQLIAQVPIIIAAFHRLRPAFAR